jgi:hypothetical protein
MAGLPLEPAAPVDGLLGEDSGMLVVSVFLLHPANASAAARAIATTVPVFSVGAYISVFPLKIGMADCQPASCQFICAPSVCRMRHRPKGM